MDLPDNVTVVQDSQYKRSFFGLLQGPTLMVLEVLGSLQRCEEVGHVTGNFRQGKVQPLAVVVITAFDTGQYYVGNLN